MSDKEKVIKGLHGIGDFIADCVGFEQAKNFLHTIDEAVSLLKEQEDLGTELTNAVELIHKKNERIEKLLKEQEAVEPIPPTDESDLWKCGNCNNQIFRCTQQRYCEMCGKKVKWDE